VPQAKTKGPSSTAQGLGEHVPPFVHVPAQFACVVTVQVVPTQHEPVWQGLFGLHVPPFVQVPAQFACVVTVQAVPVQHEPV
jgi:hypothetical protein